MAQHAHEWFTRQAASIVSQLPEDTASAVKVLDFARRILTDADIPSCANGGCPNRIRRIDETPRS